CILQDGKRDAILLDMGGDALGSILPVGIDGNQLHAFFSIVPVQVTENRHKGVVDGTLGAEEDDNNSLAVSAASERERFARVVLQCEVLNSESDFCWLRRGDGHRNKTSQQSCSHQENLSETGSRGRKGDAIHTVTNPNVFQLWRRQQASMTS